jgi:hypothetical protein
LYVVHRYLSRLVSEMTLIGRLYDLECSRCIVKLVVVSWHFRVMVIVVNQFRIIADWSFLNFLWCP